jgi:hypothetical protein
MKRYVAKMLTLAAISLSACTADSGPDKFLGKWQSVRDPKRPALVIEKRGESLVVGGGMDGEYPASYDKEQKKLQFNMPMAGTLDVVYLPETDHLLITQAGEYIRVKQ